jgi:hypothetical protein
MSIFSLFQQKMLVVLGSGVLRRCLLGVTRDDLKKRRNDN